MEVTWKAPVRSADEVEPIDVSISRVFGIEQFFNISDWQSEVHPVFGGRVFDVGGVDVLVEPFLHQCQSFRSWLDQFINIGLAEVLAVAVVFRIGDYR